MIKPIWAAVAGVGLLGTAGIAGAFIVASSGGEEEVVQQISTITPTASSESFPTPTAALATPTGSPSLAACDPGRTPMPGTRLWRWGDLTIMIPQGVLAYGDVDQTGQSVLVIFPQEINQSYRTEIDATTGNIVSVSNDASGLRPKEAEIQAALTTISICPFDPTTALWPYGGAAPEETRQVFANISYLQPDPAAGVQARTGAAGAAGSPGGAEARLFLAAQSASSSVYVDAGNGQVIEPAKIAPQEQAAFSRFLASIQVTVP